jgi:transposase
VEQVAATLATGGEVWFGDETTLREFPPLRASWAKRGQQRQVVISGRNGRRVIHGALNARSGELVELVRERSRQDDCIAFLERLGQTRPQVPKLLIWDNAPPHHPKRVHAAAEQAQVTLAWLPFRSPELNPLEDLWRLLKAVIAANRVYDALDALAAHALAWLDACSPASLLTRCGLNSSKFQWLPT